MKHSQQISFLLRTSNESSHFFFSCIQISILNRYKYKHHISQVVWNVLSTYSGLLAGNVFKLIKSKLFSLNLGWFAVLGKVSKSDLSLKCLASTSLRESQKDSGNISPFIYIIIKCVFSKHFTKYKKRYPKIFFEKFLNKINLNEALKVSFWQNV